jgi:hypothetical protein
VEIGEIRDVAKWRPDRAEALMLARKASRLVAMKGKKKVVLDLREGPSDDDLAVLLLGPTGAMRAPSMWVGDTLVVGFAPEVYEEVLR